MHDLFNQPDARKTLVLNSGFTLDLVRPDATGMPIEDIAVSLASQNRWSGATVAPYTVAEHAVMTSYLVPEEYAFDALHHDDEEITGDDPSPKKNVMAIKTVKAFIKAAQNSPYFAPLHGFNLDTIPDDAFHRVVNKELLNGFYKPIKHALAKEFGFRYDLAVVKQADLICMATEKRDIVPASWIDWSFLPEPHSEKIVPLKCAKKAAKLYLDRHYELIKTRG